MRVVSPTAAAIGEAVRDARAAWGPAQTLLFAAAVGGVLVPFAVDDPLTVSAFAGTLYLAVAAVGLAVPVGLGGMPVLSQGAFFGVGAVAAALLRVHGDWPPLAAALIGSVAAALVALLIGAGLGRLRAAFIAVGTWIAAWLIARAFVEFPDLAGGAEGLVVTRGDLAGIALTPTAHYELALALVVLAALAFSALARGAPGEALAALRERPAAASTLGVPALRLRAAAFGIAGALAGLAGGFAVQLEGIADPAAYAPFLSFTLFVAVVLGGARTASGAVAGTLAVSLIFWSADRIADYADIATGRLDALFGAVLLLAVLAIESESMLPDVYGRLRRARPPEALSPAGETPEPVRPATLRAVGLHKQFGGDVAVEALDLELSGGGVTALVGPNGSGKTTALRLLAGTLPPDAGRITLDAMVLPAGGQRERAVRGIVRTLQATAVFGDRTVLENVLVGAGLRGRHGGVLRTLSATPKARRETDERRARALAALAEVGLDGAAGRRVSELSGAEQRLVMLAAALATRPRVLLIDEPSAGASPADVQRVAGVLRSLATRGLAVLVVEHNLRLVRRVADRVIVLDAGRAIASGTPDEVAADPAVRLAYLGRRGL
ncbi:MAG: ATP-binding cassette domain-containing protein [Gaiellaceae bacterium]